MPGAPVFGKRRGFQDGGPVDRLRNLAYRAYKAIETREHRLLYLFFEVTRRCNLACLHCGSDCGRGPAVPEMTLDTWRSAMDYVKARYDPLVVLTGGEPLVRPDILDLADSLGERGLHWGMVTNGFALTAPVLARLVGGGIESITVSIDGDEKGHRFLRRHPEAYPRAVRALDLVGASTIRYKDAVTCVHPGNMDSLDAVGSLLVERGFGSWRLFRIFPSGAAARHPELGLDRGRALALVDWIAANRRRYRAKGLDLQLSCEGFLPFHVDRRVRTEPFFCRSGINVAAILSDGTITGCSNNPPFLAQGNVATDDFDEVWDRRFEPFRDRRWLRVGACADCGLWRDCLGGSIHLRAGPDAGPAFCYARDTI